MKKVLSVLFALLISATMFAGNTVKVVNGKKEAKEIFKDKTTALAQIDWSKVKYDNTKDLHETWGDKYDYFVKACTENFVKGFNDENKGLQVATNANDAKYKMVVKLTNIDKYFNVMNIVPGHTVKIWATIIITTANGDQQVEIEVDSMKGSRDFSPDDCYTKAFKILGERVAKAI